MLLVGEGSGCLSSVFVSLDTEACAFTRRKLWSFFLDTLWPRFYQRSVKVNDRCEWLTYFRLLAPSTAAQLFGCFGLLDAGPYRLEGGGITSGFILPLGLMDGGRRWAPDEGWWVMNALEFGMKIGSGNHYYFCHFANAAFLPSEPLTSETSLSKKT